MGVSTNLTINPLDTVVHMDAQPMFHDGSTIYFNIANGPSWGYSPEPFMALPTAPQAGRAHPRLRSLQRHQSRTRCEAYQAVYLL